MMCEFFNEMFDHGVTLVHILAWHSGQRPDSPFHVPRGMQGPHLAVAK